MNQHLPLNNNPTLMLEPDIQQQPASMLNGRHKQPKIGDGSIQVQSKQKPDFFEPNLENFQPPLYPSPKVTPYLINQLLEHRLLVLGGENLDLDTLGLARHLACILAAELQKSHGQIHIKEWYRSIDPYSDPAQRLFTELQTAATTIFILPHIIPQQINHDLSQIERSAANGNNYVLISTDIPRTSWNLAESESKFWSELLTDNLYSNDDNQNLKQWFHKVLKPREQLLALGLNFFDGLFDDQCIAGMWKLIEHEWYRRDRSLLALDYCDLHTLQPFFRLVEIPDQKTKKFESKLPQQRKKLFEVAWDSYRVRIQTALPVMVLLSAGNKSFDPQLGIPIEQKYDSELRRDQLRAVISEAISELGLIDIREVQESLLALASHSNPKVQAVAARAIARWRSFGHDQQLFDTLIKLKIQAEKKGSKSDNILSTIALAVGYAGKDDAPSELRKELCDLLGVLSNHPSKLVSTRFGQLTLKMLVPLHLVQLRDRLHDMTSNTNLVRWISESLAKACQTNPQEVIETIDLWHLECKGKPEFVNNRVPRAALLQTVALTCVNIICNQRIDVFTVNTAFQHLQVILTEEKQSFDSKTVLKEIRHHTNSQNFQQVEPKLKELVGWVTNGDCHEIVLTLVKVYRQQRKEQAVSSIADNPPSFPVWISQERLPTAMEQAMLRWLKSEDNPAAQMIGARLALGEDLNLKNPQDVLPTLKLWYEKCKQDYPKEYEVLLTAVGLISLEILCNTTETTITQEARSYLQKILSQEALLLVRRSIVNAICTQTDQRLLQIESQLQLLFPDFHPNELPQIIKAIDSAKKRHKPRVSANTVRERRLPWRKTNENVTVPKIPTPIAFTTNQQKTQEKNEQNLPSSRKRNNAIYYEVFPLALSIIITIGLLSTLSYLLTSFLRNSITSTQQPISNSRVESIYNNP